MKTEEEKVRALKEFFKNLIESSRIEFANLDVLERKQIGNRILYQSPCQIEIFWIDHPLENQLIVVFHDKHRQDLEIIVNGPFKGSELIAKGIEIMNQPRWQMEAPYDRGNWPNNNIDVGDRQNKYSGFFVLPFSHFIFSIRNQPLIPIKNGLSGGDTIRKQDFFFSIRGNILSLTSEDLLIYDPIYYAKRIAALEREGYNAEAAPTTGVIQEKQSLTLFGAYFYPPIRIGDNVERSFEEKLIDQIGRTYYLPKCDFEYCFNGKIGFYYSYGFIAIQGKERLESKNILNTIFGITLITGIDVFSIKDSDIWEVKMDEDTKSIGLYSGGLQNSDSSPFKSKGFGRYAITIDAMKKIISAAEKVYPIEKIRDSLLFLLESHTHLKDQEFSQSFVFSWLIAEKNLSKKFEGFLKEKKVIGKRKDKFQNHDKWSTESKLELLEFNEKISHEDYTFLIEHNTKRNNFVHKGAIINGTDADKLFNYCLKLVKTEIDLENC